MEFIKSVEANPNTKVRAWHYKLTKEEFDYVGKFNTSNHSPSERSTIMEWNYNTYGTPQYFEVTRNKAEDTYFLVCYGLEDRTEYVEECILKITHLRT